MHTNQLLSRISRADMTYTTESASTTFSNRFDSSTQFADAVPATVALFKRLSVDDQLALLWYAYTEMGSSITPAAPGAARLQLAEGLLSQIKKMSYAEQLQVMRDLAANRNTAISRGYGVLSTNTKLAFWYELSVLMEQGIVAPMPPGYQPSSDVTEVLQAIKSLDFGQQITVLRNTVVDMGVDPLAD